MKITIRHIFWRLHLTVVVVNGVLGAVIWMFNGTTVQADNARDTHLSSGQIVFMSNRDDKGDFNRELYGVDTDDKTQTRLTNDPGFDGSPDVSPDGRQIVFYSNRDGTLQIYVVHSDGSGLKRLTSGASNSLDPAFGDHGSRIIFRSNRNSNTFQIYLMNADGSSQIRVAGIEGDEPALSLDGRQIVFSTVEGRGTYINIMNAEGTHIRRLTAGSDPAFSPDGRRIMYMLANGISSEIYTMNVDGTKRRRLSPCGASDAAPRFSPDGSQVVFSSDFSRRTARAAYFADKNGTGGLHDIYVMNADGSRATRLTRGPGNNVHPAWGRFPNKAFTPLPLPAALPSQLTPADGVTIFDDILPPILGGVFQGELLSAFNDLQLPPYYSYLTSRNFRSQRRQAVLPDRKKQIVSTYRIRGLEGEEGDLAFDPQFSPDGKYVLVKIGDPEIRPGNPYDFYQLYLWERGTDQWKKISSQNLFLRFTSWSPDGNHVAYIVGNEVQDEAGLCRNEPLQLLVYNRHNGQQQKVVQNNTVLNVAWSGPDTLLYAMLTQEQQKLWAQQRMQRRDQTKGDDKGGKLAVRPNVYEYSLKSGQAKLLIKDGQHPVVSPNGEWIAFFGSQNSDKPFPLNDDWWRRPGGAALSVIRRDGTGRKPLTVEGGVYPFVSWRPDNQHLLTLKQIQESPDAQAEIKEWNITTGAWRKVATLSGKDYIAFEHSAAEPQFQPIELSKDGRFLFVRVSEYSAPKKDEAQPVEMTSLQAVNLQTGEVTTLAKFKNAAGFDWHDETPPAKKASQSKPAAIKAP